MGFEMDLDDEKFDKDSSKIKINWLKISGNEIIRAALIMPPQVEYIHTLYKVGTPKNEGFRGRYRALTRFKYLSDYEEIINNDDPANELKIDVKTLGPPQAHAAIALLIYPTDGNGKIDVAELKRENLEVRFAHLTPYKLSQFKEENRLLKAEDKSMMTVDFIIREETKEAKYKSWEFRKMTDSTFLKNKKKLQKKVKELFEKELKKNNLDKWEDITNQLGYPMTESQWYEKLSSVGHEVEAASSTSDGDGSSDDDDLTSLSSKDENPPDLEGEIPIL